MTHFFLRPQNTNILGNLGKVRDNRKRLINCLKRTKDERIKMSELKGDPNPDKGLKEVAMRRCNAKHPKILNLRCVRKNTHDLESGHWGVHKGVGFLWKDRKNG